MPDVLVAYRVANEEHLAGLRRKFELHYAPTPGDRQAAIATLGASVRAVITNGPTGLNADQIAALPALGLIACIGAGHENVDLDAAKRRGIAVTHSPNANSGSVADHAMALVLAALRGLREADAIVRAGGWMEARIERPAVSGRRLGILGLGVIGHEIARRATNGFCMAVAYHNRRPRADVDFTYCASIGELAAWSDILVVSAPGGDDTRHAVNADVLRALGPDGVLVNVGRGSIVDNDALHDALSSGTIRGAALDVVDGEPGAPEGLRTLPNIIITPHVGSFSPEAYGRMVEMTIANVEAFLAGRPVLNPVPMPTERR